MSGQLSQSSARRLRNQIGGKPPYMNDLDTPPLSESFSGLGGYPEPQRARYIGAILRTGAVLEEIAPAAFFDTLRDATDKAISELYPERPQTSAHELAQGIFERSRAQGAEAPLAPESEIMRYDPPPPEVAVEGSQPQQSPSQQQQGEQ